MTDKLERLRAMRDDYEAALDDAARLRDDYHREIVKLSRAGVSMREIAEALGISHQRVHQIVSPRDQDSSRRRRRGAGVVIASVIVACLLAGGASLFMRSWGDDSPTASPAPPSAASIESDKDAACARFLELFRNQGSITENVDCAETVRPSLGV